MVLSPEDPGYNEPNVISKVADWLFAVHCQARTVPPTLPVIVV